MSNVFIIQNQHNCFLDKKGDWVDQAEARSLYRTHHKDEAINVKVEHSVRRPDLRLRVVSCNIDHKGQLQIVTQQHPPAQSVDRGEKGSFTTPAEKSRTEWQTDTPDESHHPSN